MQDYSFEPYWNLKIHILREGAIIKFAPISGKGDVKFKVLSLDGDYATLINITPLTSRSSPSEDFYTGVWKQSPTYVYVGTLNNKMMYVSRFVDSGGQSGPDSKISAYQATLDSTLLSNMKTNHMAQNGWVRQASGSTDYTFEANTIGEYGQWETTKFKKMSGSSDMLEFDRKLSGFDFEWFGTKYGLMSHSEFKEYFNLSMGFDEGHIHDIAFIGSFAYPESDQGLEKSKVCCLQLAKYTASSEERFALRAPVNGYSDLNAWTGLMWVVNLKNFANWSFAD